MKSFTLTFNHGEFGSHGIRYFPSEIEMQEKGLTTIEAVMADMIEEAWSAYPGVYCIPNHNRSYVISVNMETVLTLQGQIDIDAPETETV